MNRHFQWPNLLKMKETKKLIFRSFMQNGQNGHLASSSEAIR